MNKFIDPLKFVFSKCGVEGFLVQIGQVKLLLAATACLTLISCGSISIGRGPKEISSINGKGPIALVGFGLNNAVMHDSKTVADERDEEDIDNEYIKASVDALYSEFKASFDQGLGGHAVIPLSKVEGHAGYQEKFKPKESSFLGLKGTSTSSFSSSRSMSAEDKLEMSEASYSTPDRIYRPNVSNTRYLDKLAKELGAGLLMFMDYKASYKAPAEMTVDELATVMVVRVRIKLYDPGKGVVWKHVIPGYSTKHIRVVGKKMPSKEYPDLISDAHSNLIPNIQEVFRILEEGYKPENDKKKK